MCTSRAFARIAPVVLMKFLCSFFPSVLIILTHRCFSALCSQLGCISRMMCYHFFPSLAQSCLHRTFKRMSTFIIYERLSCECEKMSSLDDQFDVNHSWHSLLCSFFFFFIFLFFARSSMKY